MRVSVILATYNQPVWLEKVLWGYSAQTHSDFELLIADDGSRPDTAEVVDRMQRETGLEIRHVWHEDRGFRKCEILNRAILAATCDYLIFSDGDCIPRADFVEAHCSRAEVGRFLSGGALRLPMSTSHVISNDDVRSGRFSDARWLREHGWSVPARHRLRLLRSRGSARILDALTPTGATWNGGNASTWRELLFRINGYDQTMQYGGEDRAVGERLRNAGYHGTQIRYSAVLLHLEHERPYRTNESILYNRAVRERIRRDSGTRAPEGLRELARSLTAIDREGKRDD